MATGLLYPQSEEYKKYKRGGLSLTRLIEHLLNQCDDLDICQKEYIRYRWVDNLKIFEKSAVRVRNAYYALNLVVITFGIILPGLAAFKEPLGIIPSTYDALVSVMGIVIALATGINRFFRFGDEWKHYLNIYAAVEKEGWLYFSLTGAYNQYANRQAGFKQFSENLENLLEKEMITYVTDIIKGDEKKEDKSSDDSGKSVKVSIKTTQSGGAKFTKLLLNKEPLEMSHPGDKTISLEAGKEYILSWEIKNEDSDGTYSITISSESFSEPKGVTTVKNLNKGKGDSGEVTFQLK